MSVQDILRSLRRLDELLGSLGGLSRAYAAADELFFNIACAPHEALRGAQQRLEQQLLRLLLSVCDKLAALEAALPSAAESSRHGDERERQALAGSLTAAACLCLGSLLLLEGDEPLKVARAARIVLCSGRAHLAKACREARHRSPAGTAAARRCGGAAADEQTKLLSRLHLTALESTMLLLEASGQPGLLAGFASQVAPPDVLLPWLATVCDAIQAHPEVLAEPSVPVMLVNSVGPLLCSPAFQEHRRELAASMHHARPLVAVLADHALPALVRSLETSSGTGGSGGSGGSDSGGTTAGVSASAAPATYQPMPGDQPDLAAMAPRELGLFAAASRLCFGLAVPALSAAVREQLGELGGAALVRQVARLAAALPVLRPEAAASPSLCRLQRDVCASLGHLFILLSWEPQQPTDDSQPAPGSGGGGGGGQATPGSAHSMWRAAAWDMLQLLPWLGAFLTSVLAQDALDLAWYVHAFMPCFSSLLWSCELLTLSAAGERDAAQGCGSWEDAAAWLAAAHAALQLAPLLSQLDDRWRQAGLPPLPAAAMGPMTPLSAVEALVDGAVFTASQAVNWWMDSPAAVSNRPHSEAEQAAARGLASRLWQVHSAGCCLLHWLAARDGVPDSGGPEQRTCGFWAAEPSLLLRSVLDFLNVLMAAAHCLHDLHGPARDQGGRCLAAMCAAHWEAVKVAAALVPGAVEDGQGIYAPNLSHAIAVLAVDAALLVEPAMVALLRAALTGDEPGIRTSCLVELLASGKAVPPRLAATLTDAGMLEELLGAHLRPPPWLDQVHGMHVMASNVLHGLACGVAGTLTRSPSGEQRQMVQHWLNTIRDTLQQGDSLPDEEAAAALQDLRQPGAELAALLLQHYQQPQQVAAAQLERAQAAAARSCAFLHCSNVGLEGGPAAGEGRGSMRCGACRGVWYCGTGCSHADWRGPSGHRKVCAALASARQAQRGQQGSSASLI